MVSARHVLLYNVQLFEIGKTEVKKTASTFVHVSVTLPVKGHLKVILILEKFPLSLPSYAAEQF